jgi:hypothetical protein
MEEEKYRYYSEKINRYYNLIFLKHERTINMDEQRILRRKLAKLVAWHRKLEENRKVKL